MKKLFMVCFLRVYDVSYRDALIILRFGSVEKSILIGDRYWKDFFFFETGGGKSFAPISIN
jgi:hypothetical protein